MQWDESCAWEWRRKACHLEKSLPRYAGYNDFPPTLLRNEESNWASPSSHDGAVTVPASLPATHERLKAWGVLPKNWRIQRAVSPEGTWHQGWLSSCRDHAATATGCTISNTPTHLAPAQGENRFSQNLQCDLYNTCHQNPPIYLCSQHLEKHQVLSAGKSKLFTWVPLWLLSYSLCSEMQPGSSLKSSFRFQFGGSFLSHHQVFSPIFQFHSSKKICTDCSQEPRSLSSYNEIHWAPSQSF